MNAPARLDYPLSPVLKRASELTPEQIGEANGRHRALLDSISTPDPRLSKAMISLIGDLPRFPYRRMALRKALPLRLQARLDSIGPVNIDGFPEIEALHCRLVAWICAAARIDYGLTDEILYEAEKQEIEIGDAFREVSVCLRKRGLDRTIRRNHG